jgi:hypothetical protein
MNNPNVVRPPQYIGGHKPNVPPQQTVADNKPMDAEEGDFIINAAAAEFAGKQDLQNMIGRAITNLQERGVDISFGNPKINIRDKVKLLVSQNEVYVPKLVAKEIGYDRLEKINNRGKRRTQEIQKNAESPQGAYLGGNVKKEQGERVIKAGFGIEDILKALGIFGLYENEPDRFKKSPRQKKAYEAFIKRKTEKNKPPMPPPSRKFFGISYPILVQALERVETGDVNLDVQMRNKYRDNPYKYTEVTVKGPEGSSAFGLRQMTYTAMQQVLKDNRKILEPEEIAYAEKFIDFGKQRVNLEQTGNEFVYVGPKNNRKKIPVKDKAQEYGISAKEYIQKLGNDGEGLIPISEHKKHYNTFANLFFQNKLIKSKSLEKGIATYYSNTPSDKRTEYVNKFKKALKQIQGEKSIGITPDIEEDREKIKPNTRTPIEKENKMQKGFIIPNYDKQGNRIEKLGI